MKRKNTPLLDNMLTGLDLAVTVVGTGYSILNQLPQFNMPRYFAHGIVLSILVGAILRLADAHVDGYEQVYNHYWWTRYYGKRRRCNDSRRHS